MEHLNDTLKFRYKNFSESTSMNGFKELYTAKSLFWKSFWIIVVTSSLCLAMYQVNKVVFAFIYQNSYTVIQPLPDDQVIYPPIKVCYPHWIYWVNWKAGYNLNFTKEAMLYGLSFMSNVYSEAIFDIDEAKENFLSGMLANNITKLSDFYQIIAKNTLSLELGQAVNGEVVNKLGSLYFCYIISGELVKDNTEHPENERKELVLKTIKYGPYSQTVTEREYKSYMTEWIEDHATDYQLTNADSSNFSAFYPPILFFPDGFADEGIQIYSDIDRYFIDVKISAHIWKNSASRRCIEAKQSVMSDMSCTIFCNAQKSYEFCNNNSKLSLEHAASIQQDEPDKVIRRKIYFVNNSAQKDFDFEGTVVRFKYSKHGYPCNLNNGTVMSEISDNSLICLKSQCVSGCEKWNYVISARESSLYQSLSQLAKKRSTSIKITYPVNGDVILMTEVDSQTWETFVSNVGGALSLWTGASIVAIIQIFYLCCFSGNIGPCQQSCYKVKFNNENRMIQATKITASNKVGVEPFDKTLAHHF